MLASDLSQTPVFSARGAWPGTPSAPPVPHLATLRNKPSSGETRTLPPIWAAILVVAVAAPAAQIGLLCSQRALGIRAASHPVCALARPDPPVP